MQVKIDQSKGTSKVILTGRLGIPGAEAVALPLAILTHSNRVVIDMGGVPSITLIGLEHLVPAAKWIKRRGGCFILLNPNSIGKSSRPRALASCCR